MKRAYTNLILTALLLLTAVSLAAFDVTIGSGNEQNRKPFDFYYRFSLFETLYYPEELNTAGVIQSITFYNNFPNSSYSDGRIQIWLGTTNLPDLTAGWIPSTQLTSVVNRSVNFPNGQNEITIPLSTPFHYAGGNLVLLARTPGNNTWAANPLNFYCQTVGTNRARDFFSNSINADHANPPMTGLYLNLSGQFPKTTFHFSDSPLNPDLGVAILTGPLQMQVGNAYTHTVTVNNAGTSAQSGYLVKLYDWNNQELASASGPSLSAGASAEVAINWTPNLPEGYSSLYAKVILTGDQNQFNDCSQPLEVCYLPVTGGGNHETLGTLKGIVRDGTGQPLANAGLQLNPSAQSVQTSSDGSFCFSWLEPGMYQVAVSAAGFVGKTYNAEVTAGHSSALFITLYSIENLVISGRVVASANEVTGIANATVELVGAVTTAVATDAMGYFSIYGVLANQSYTLRASHPAYLTYNGEVNVVSQSLDVGVLHLDFDFSTPTADEEAVEAPVPMICSPNPFTTEVTISYQLKNPGFASLEIYNVRGQKVATLYKGTSKAGNYSASWNGRDSSGRQVGGGIYFCRLTGAQTSLTRKLMYLW